MLTTVDSQLKSAEFIHGKMINANCLDALKHIENKSVACIIIDPPYGAQTHGQNTWDIAWSADFWKEIIRHSFRILTTGGHLVVFSSGKTFRKIENKIFDAYQTLFGQEPSNYPMVWEHSSLDSGRVHSHTPRSQFEFLSVFFRTGEGKGMISNGTLNKLYFDPHVGRSNILKYYKDDCRNKPQPTVQKFFKDMPNNWTFDYKPEALLRAIIRDFTSPGHTVVDFCMRHGMTAVAATLEGRNFIGVEVEETAYKRAVSRYSELFNLLPPVVTAPVPLALTYPTESDTESEKTIPLIPEKSVTPPTTRSVDRRRKRFDLHEEPPAKRCAISYDGSILEVGTLKRFVELYVYKKLDTLDGNDYLVAFPDKLGELKAMSLKKKDVRRHCGRIDSTTMEILSEASMPPRY